jgi:hypothetical protein
LANERQVNVIGEGYAGSPPAAIAQIARNPHRLDLLIERAFEKSKEVSSAALRSIRAVPTRIFMV